MCHFLRGLNIRDPADSFPMMGSLEYKHGVTEPQDPTTFWRCLLDGLKVPSFIALQASS